MEENTTLNLMLDLIPLYEYLHTHGLLSLTLHGTLGIQLRNRDFLRYFPDHGIAFYTDSEGKPAKEGYAIYKGQRFFALLDYEPYKEEEDVQPE